MTNRFAGVALALVVSALAGCAQPSPNVNVGIDVPVAVPATSAGPGLRALQVNGTVLNYVDTGSASADVGARPIVLVHGTIGYYGEWRRQVAAFSATRRTIAYSRRYHLPNPRVEDGETAYTPQLHAADLVAFLRALRLGPVDLVGSSYGGAVVIEVARQHPEMVHALVLAEPAVNLYTNAAAEDSVRRFAAVTIEAIDTARALFARGDSTRGLRTFIDGSLGPGAFDAAPADARGYFASQMFELRREMLTPGDKWLPRMACSDLAPIRMPVLVLVGGETLPIYHSMMDHLAACIPGTHVATIPGVGHHLVENSRAFNAEVLRFLGGLPH